MINLRDAAIRAVDFYRDIDPEAQDPRVEEVEKDEDSSDWLITLSFISNETVPGLNFIAPNSASTGVMNGRKYKIFGVKADTGEVESMKIRVLQR